MFTTIVFLPALSEGPLGYDATRAGLTISPRGIGTMATMLAVGYLIDKIDHRVLLVTGMMITAGAFELISQMPPTGGEIWLAGASAIQGVGVGLLFTPLSTLAFSSLAADLRTDAAGVYSLLRQLGCATGVAAMTALLQARIQANYRHGRPGCDRHRVALPPARRGDIWRLHRLFSNHGGHHRCHHSWDLSIPRLAAGPGDTHGRLMTAAHPGLR